MTERAPVAAAEYPVDRYRFEALWSRCVDGGSAPSGREMFDELLARYSEPHRRYHTPGHIIHCLRQFDLAAPHMDDPDAVELALWFHDAIYDTSAPDNERMSAELFVERADGGCDEALRRKVYDLIMVTIHRDPPESLDGKFLVDIDLSSFGLPWPKFVRDSFAVRDEFPAMSDADFFPRQREFLKSLLARPHFCFTEFFRDRHEQVARDNITRHLELLSEKGLA